MLRVLRKKDAYYLEQLYIGVLRLEIQGYYEMYKDKLGAGFEVIKENHCLTCGRDWPHPRAERRALEDALIDMVKLIVTYQCCLTEEYILEAEDLVYPDPSPEYAEYLASSVNDDDEHIPF